MAHEILTSQSLRAVLAYDPETGVFTWLVRAGNAKVGDTAGHVNTEGYRMIKVGNASRRAHRLAWLYVHGEWPANQIDHRDGDRSNNKFDNLRDVNNSVNQQNQRGPRSNNTSGFLGVSWHKKDRNWCAQITIEGRRNNIGAYPTPELASAAYLSEKRRLHSGCTL
jgi:hypothetical protein